MQYIIRFIGGTGFFGKSILPMLKRGFGPELKFTVISRDQERFLTNHPEFLELSHSLSEGRGRDYDRISRILFSLSYLLFPESLLYLIKLNWNG